MKKLFLFVVGLLCAQAVFAASTTTKNTMKMVAYFPVPYVAYDTVSATQALDVGVLNECRMSLGENQSNLGYSNCSLYLYGAAAGTDDARRGLLNVSAGKLNLNAIGFTSTPIIRSSNVFVGSGGTAGYGLLEIGKPGGKDPNFNALYISSLAYSGDSVRATGDNSVDDMAAKVTAFKMFDEIANNFPACNGTVTWQELELGGDVSSNKTYKDVYLVCKNGEVLPPDPFTGCSVCSDYDVDSTEYENCVLNNVTSCCSYAYNIYTKRGQNAFELMKDTSCYECEKVNGSDHIHAEVNMGVDYLNYIANYTAGGRTFKDYVGTSIDCTERGYPDSKKGTWVSLGACPGDGSCGGGSSCMRTCVVSNCNEIMSTCHVNAVILNCRTTCQPLFR